MLLVNGVLFCTLSAAVIIMLLVHQEVHVDIGRWAAVKLS